MNTLQANVCAYIKIIYVNIITMLGWGRGRGRRGETGRQTAVVWLEQGCQKLPTGTLIPATYLWMYLYLCKCIRSCSCMCVCVCVWLQVSVKCKTLVCARVSVRYKDIASVAAGRGLLLLFLVPRCSLLLLNECTFQINYCTQFVYVGVWHKMYLTN